MISLLPLLPYCTTVVEIISSMCIGELSVILINMGNIHDLTNAVHSQNLIERALAFINSHL